MRLRWLCGTVLAVSAFGQTNNYPYYLKPFAGAYLVGDGRPGDTAFLGDGGLATSAYLMYPTAPIVDAKGNLFILDSSTFRIRKVTPDGRIDTFAKTDFQPYDMKLAADGNLYVAGSGRVIKVSPSGTVTAVAGTFTGYAGDGGPASAAQLDLVQGIALDASGNIYLTDVHSPATRVRMISTDGTIRTIAGTAANGFSGDNQPAISSNLSSPKGIAVDGSGNIYVADGTRIRKFKVGGTMSAVAGTGIIGQPTNGQAIGSNLGNIVGLYLDNSNNLYATDSTYNVVLKITPDGILTRVAGNFNAYGATGDGIATGVSLLSPDSVTWSPSGILYITDCTHIVRRLTPDGNLTAIAGKIHFAGDNGPAVSALLNEPTDVALDGQGNVYIADAENYRLRKVTAGRTITTVSGNGTPGKPLSGSAMGNAQLPYVYSMATDSQGAMYLATYYQIFKVTPDGLIRAVVGTGSFGNTGDGGLATAATIGGATSVAVDASGNIYFADGNANRIRKVASDTGIISAYVGTGARGYGGDGGLATGALLNLDFFSSLAVDSKGNLYVGDSYNLRVRMVTPAGTIGTVVGNGTYARPDGIPATSGGFSVPAALACDGAGNVYIASGSFGDLYKLSGGVIRLIAGNGSALWIDGTPARDTFLYAVGLKVDQNGDIYASDCCDYTVLKLVLNSPVGMAIADGDRQTAQPGQTLTKALKVQLSGRAGVGVSGATVNFAVTSGSATLSAATALTDAGGAAGIVVTLGAAPGEVIITATAAGTGLAPVQFTETAAILCSVPLPVVASVNSAGDFGGSKTFAPGSWLEIKGSNLAQSTRQWGGSDFNGANAPTSLDGVSVTINGVKAYVGYISPGQINVQAPSGAVTGDVQLTVTTSSCSSGGLTVAEAAIAPGLLAPASFRIGGTQYLAATFQDGATFVGNANLIPGVPFRAAAPGDNITAYGIGFGPVTPQSLPGTVASGTNSIPNLAISFGAAPAQITYGGLAPGTVGLYQFNFVVPNVPDGDYPIAVQAGATKVSQAVYLTVHR